MDPQYAVLSGRVGAVGAAMAGTDGRSNVASRLSMLDQSIESRLKQFLPLQ